MPVVDFHGDGGFAGFFAFVCISLFLLLLLSCAFTKEK